MNDSWSGNAKSDDFDTGGEWDFPSPDFTVDNREAQKTAKQIQRAERKKWRPFNRMLRRAAEKP